METTDSRSANAELLRIIEEMTTSGRPILEETKCKQLKAFCKQSDENVNRAYYLIWSQLEKDHSQIRLSAVQIIDMLFIRSAGFRDLLLSHFQDFTELSIGINRMLPLPGPLHAAKELKLQSIRFIRNWYETFGSAYKELQLAFNYLKDCKHIRFDDVLLNVNEDEIREGIRLESVKQIKLNVALEQFAELFEETKSCLTEVESCLNLLLPKPSEFDVFSIKFSNSSSSDEELHEKNVILHENGSDNSNDVSDNQYDDDDDDDTDFLGRTSYQRTHGFSNQAVPLILNMNDKKLIQVTKSDDNAVVINTMNEKVSFLTLKCFPTLQKILKTFSQCGANAEHVKRAIDVKLNIEGILKKVNQIDVLRGNVTSDVRESDDSDCDEFIEVLPIDCSNGCTPSLSRSCDIQTPIDVTGFHDHSSDTMAKTSALSDKNASVVDSEPTGSNPSSSGVPDDIWDFFNASKWKCRAPMSNGKLCFRMNKTKCPFHGVILPRDKRGQPNKPGWTKALALERENQQRNSWRDPVMEAEIFAATGIDLSLNSGKKKKRSKKSELINMKALKNNTSRKRLEKKLLKFAKSKRK